MPPVMISIHYERLHIIVSREIWMKHSGLSFLRPTWVKTKPKQGGDWLRMYTAAWEMQFVGIGKGYVLTRTGSGNGLNPIKIFCRKTAGSVTTESMNHSWTN